MFSSDLINNNIKVGKHFEKKTAKGIAAKDMSCCSTCDFLSQVQEYLSVNKFIRNE